MKENIDVMDSYDETYTMRTVGGGISTSIPKKIVKRKARSLGISIEDFVEKYRVQMFFDDFDSVDGAFKFVKKEEVED